jgi:putative DNA methylase
MNATVVTPKKLIEVALPLDIINAAAAREKSIRHGHPSTLHLWWARRPLAVARAVIFSQLVHDPEDLWRCQNPDKQPIAQVKASWTRTRARFFRIIEALVQWENTTNEQVLNEARECIRESWKQTCELNKAHPQAAELFNPEKMPGLHDPFAGGGAIPLEAQRLGLSALASDLNPVAILINKAMIEIPAIFSGSAPVHPSHHAAKSLIDAKWRGASGLAADVGLYGNWIKNEAERRIGELYPKVLIDRKIVEERPDLEGLIGKELTVIAWIWARTVKSPNPAYASCEVPLASTFVLSSKEGREAYVAPIIGDKEYVFKVKSGQPPSEAKSGTKLARGANFSCIFSGTPIEPAYIKAEATAGRMGSRLMAIVAEGDKGRVYLDPSDDHVKAAERAKSNDAAVTIHVPLADDPRAIWCVRYGLTHYDHLFSRRQLFALATFGDLVAEVREQIIKDAISCGFPDDDIALSEGGCGARAYAEAVSLYLAFVANKGANYWSSLCAWASPTQKMISTFGRQALPMIWDFAEANPFSDSSGNFEGGIRQAQKFLLNAPAMGQARVVQQDAQTQIVSCGNFVSTDPPYYDNIGYADLSDFFYVWLRRNLREVFPGLLATIAVPKAEELVASPYRHGSKEKAEVFFLDGMTRAMHHLASQAHPSAPVTIYYAFKQSDTEGAGTNSTGWETFLEAVIRAGLSIGGTWPMRTELVGNLKKTVNALASSIILVCRPRDKTAGSISRRQFIRMLNENLPLALDAMTRADEGEHSPVAPVDLAQAMIGPGMALFSRYDAVLEADGTAMTVKTALQLINRFLAEDDFDADTQFCLHWFEQYGWTIGRFGEADVLARSKGTSVEGVRQAGVVESGGGNVRLLRWREYPANWDPASDLRLPVWEALHHLVRVFASLGEEGAAKILAGTQDKGEAIRQLAYRLYTLCERKGWAEDARPYNELMSSWAGIEAAAMAVPQTESQFELFGDK